MNRSGLRTVFISRDNREVVMAFADATLAGVELATGRPLWSSRWSGGTFERSFDVSPDGSTYFAILAAGQLVAVGADGRTRWSVPLTWRQGREFVGFPLFVAAAPDGTVVAVTAVDGGVEGRRDHHRAAGALQGRKRRRARDRRGARAACGERAAGCRRRGLRGRVSLEDLEAHPAVARARARDRRGHHGGFDAVGPRHQPRGAHPARNEGCEHGVGAARGEPPGVPLSCAGVAVHPHPTKLRVRGDQAGEGLDDLGRWGRGRRGVGFELHGPVGWKMALLDQDPLRASVGDLPCHGRARVAHVGDAVVIVVGFGVRRCREGRRGGPRGVPHGPSDRGRGAAKEQQRGHREAGRRRRDEGRVLHGRRP